MARHTGKNGKFKIGSNFVADLISFDITEEADTEDLTAAGDAWDIHEVTRKRWSGTVVLHQNPADAGQAVRAGATAAIEGYTEGDASGKSYLAGDVTITSVGVAHEFAGAVRRTLNITGNGILNVATVGA